MTRISFLAMISFAFGAVLADDLHQRSKRGEAETSLRQEKKLGEEQARVHGACFTSLSSCRTLSDDLTSTGMRTVLSRPPPKLPAIKLHNQGKMAVAKFDPVE